MVFFQQGRRKAWQQLCDETGAKFAGGFWRNYPVEMKFQNWKILLDTYVTHYRYHSNTFTRMRAPFLSKEKYQFRVYNENFFTKVTKFLGAQDIEIGDSSFDDCFMIKSNNAKYTIELLSNNRIKELICSISTIDLKIVHGDSFQGEGLPMEVDALYFSVNGEIRDVEKLKKLFELFGEVLISLVEMGIIEDLEPKVSF